MDHVDELHAEVWGADGRQRLNLVVRAVHGDGSPGVDASEGVGDKVALLGTSLAHQPVNPLRHRVGPPLD